MNKIIGIIALFFASLAIAEPKSPCYWSGQFVKCFPTSGFSIVSGTVSIPAIGFDADNDGTGTGIYRAGTNSLAFTANGVNTATVSSGGIWTFPSGVQFATSGGTPTSLTYYQELTHNTTFLADGTGTSPSASVAIKIVRVGSVVTLTIPSISVASGTSSIQVASVTDIPSWAIPATAVIGTTIIARSGVVATTPCPFVIRSDGDIRFYNDNTPSNFPNGITLVFGQLAFGGGQSVISYSVQ